MYGTCLNAGLIEAFSIVGHRKLHTIAFLGAAQIDRFGNLNSTCIGDYTQPEVRFPGSGGACDAASLASGFIIFMQHEKKKFVKKLDYLTSPGWLEGENSRTDAGLSRGGPLAVVTNLGVMKFNGKTKAMYLSEYYPGITLDRIRENTGFEMDLSTATEAIPPTDEELMILRNEVDPQRLILG
jgi:glutaconate CoA-transferase subunit B